MRREVRGWAARARRTLRDFITPEFLAICSISAEGRSRFARSERAVSSVREGGTLGDSPLGEELSCGAGALIERSVSEFMVFEFARRLGGAGRANRARSRSTAADKRVRPTL